MRPLAVAKQTEAGADKRDAEGSSGISVDDLWAAVSSLSEVDVETLPGSLADTLVEGLKRIQTGLTPPPPGFPQGPAGEVALQLLSEPLAFLLATQQRWGDCVGLVLGGQRVVLVAHPAAARQVLVDRADVFVKEGTAFFPGSSLAGNGLLVSDGNVWRRQRQLANPAFRKVAVEGYAKAMSSAAQRFVSQRWAGGGVFDLYGDCNELTLQVVTEALFGADMRGADAQEIAGAIRTAFEFFGRRAATAFVLPEWLPTPDNLQYNSAVRRLDEVVYRLSGAARSDGSRTIRGGPPGSAAKPAAERG